MSPSAQPMVSIVIPTYNRARFLREALDSALAQTYPVLEVIVVDDGSSDETQAVLQAYSGRVLVYCQQNRGVSAARNAGLKLSRGEYVTFLDDDDRIYPQKIARQVAYLQARPSLVWAHCLFDYIDQEGRLLSLGWFLPQGNILHHLLAHNFIWAGAPLIHRAVLEQVGGYNEKYSTAADYDLWLRICAAGHDLGCVPARLGMYRLQPGSMVTNVKRTEEEVLSILDGFFTSSNLPAETQEVRAGAYSSWHFWISRRYYATGEDAAALQNLKLAVQYQPELAADQEELAQEFISEAVDWRTPDPLAYLELLFAHLPSELDGLASKRDTITAQVYFSLALLACGRDDLDTSRDYLRQAFAFDPALWPSQAVMVEAVTHYALNLPVNPPAFVDSFLSLLPDQARGLLGHRNHINAKIEVALGFADFAESHYRLALSHFLPAIRHSVDCLRSRGYRAAVIKSIFGLLPELLRGSSR